MFTVRVLLDKRVESVSIDITMYKISLIAVSVNVHS
jgi:hypothetical protein